MESYLAAFRELVNFSRKELSVCPWLAEQSLDDILGEVLSEVAEVRSAGDPLEKGVELADLFRDVLLALLIAERDLSTPPLEDLLGRVLEKVSRRKPWVERGETVSLEEAVRIWERVKGTEKN